MCACTSLSHVCCACRPWREADWARWPGPTVCTAELQTRPPPGPCAACDPGSWPGCWYLEATCYQAHTLTTLRAFHFIHILSVSTPASLRLLESHLSSPSRPLCVFIRLDRTARISMTTSYEGETVGQSWDSGSPLLQRVSVVASETRQPHQPPADSAWMNRHQSESLTSNDLWHIWDKQSCSDLPAHYVAGMQHL